METDVFKDDGQPFGGRLAAGCRRGEAGVESGKAEEPHRWQLPSGRLLIAIQPGFQIPHANAIFASGRRQLGAVR